MYKLATIFLLITINLFAITADEILDKSEANTKSKTSKSKITEIVYKSNGDKKISKLITISMNGNEKSLMEYIEPRRIKGMKILMLDKGDNIWFYSKRTNRVRKIASHQRKQSANGSDFSYDDMSMDDNRSDYNYKLISENEKKNGKDCYQIVFTPKDDDKSYSKMIFWIDKTNFLTIYGEFYDEDGELWKKLSMRGISKKGYYWTAKQIEMENIQKDSRTVMTTDKIEFDINLKESMFSERNLKK